jgi:tetratricopeptide (TPR) repeat protein
VRQTIGEQAGSNDDLQQAVAAYRDALKETTRERVPLDWAMTQNNLGIALRRLGERADGTKRLDEAVAAYCEALQERTRERVPLAWGQSQHSLANALAEVAGRLKSATQMNEALTCIKNAVDAYMQCEDHYWLPIAESRATEIEALLAELENQSALS